MIRTATATLATLILFIALGACGKQSELDRPDPMWGAKAKADYAAQKRAQAETVSNAVAANAVSDPQNPAIEPYTNPAPARDVPIPGERTYPSGSPQSGP